MNIPKLAAVLLAPALMLGGLTGCAGQGSSAKLQVVASFYPLQYVAERIAGPEAQVTNLTKPGTEPHDIELSPRRAAEVAAADVVVSMRGVQPSLDEAISSLDGDAVVVDPAAKGFKTSNAPKVRPDDPHFWLDPYLMADLGDAVAEALTKADPGHADDYAGNAMDLRIDLQRLDLEYGKGLARCERDTVVVSHDAFSYLDRFGLRIKPIAGLSPGAEPSPKHLAELADLIRTDNITTVFSERLGSPKFADTLASDLGIDTAVLDPIEGLASADSSEDYLSLMRANLAALREAGGCS